MLQVDKNTTKKEFLQALNTLWKEHLTENKITHIVEEKNQQFEDVIFTDISFDIIEHPNNLDEIDYSASIFMEYKGADTFISTVVTNYGHWANRWSFEGVYDFEAGEIELLEASNLDDIIEDTLLNEEENFISIFQSLNTIPALINILQTLKDKGYSNLEKRYSHILREGVDAKFHKISDGVVAIDFSENQKHLFSISDRISTNDLVWN